MTGNRPNVTDPGRVIAHRGASMAKPENTLAAFCTADAQGAFWIEFDVSLLGDGTPVVHHDGTLDRCTNVSGPLSAFGASDLHRIDAGGGEPLPTLEQVLDLLDHHQMYANLEIKPHGVAPEILAAAVSRALSRHDWAHRRIIVSSFDHATLHAVRTVMPEIPIAVLFDDPPHGWWDVLDRLGAAALHLNFRHLRQSLLADAERHGADVRVFTINQPDLMETFRDLGLTGVITDHPPLFLDRDDWARWAAS